MTNPSIDNIDELDKILPNFDTWCLCSADECTKYQNYKRDKQYLADHYARREAEIRLDEENYHLKMLEQGNWRSYATEVTERIAQLTSTKEGTE